MIVAGIPRVEGTLARGNSRVQQCDRWGQGGVQLEGGQGWGVVQGVLGRGRGVASDSVGSGTSRFLWAEPRCALHSPWATRPRGRLPCAHFTGKETEE